MDPIGWGAYRDEGSLIMGGWREKRMPTTTGTAATLMRATAREVAIVMEASASFSRGVLEGVSRWIGEHEGWMITIDDREPGVPIPGWLLRWDVHGVISGLGESSLPRAWRAGQRPVVHVCRRMPSAPLPGVYPDDEAAVRLGLEHLAGRGVRHLVFSPGPSAAMKTLCDAAARHAAALGCRLDIHEPRRQLDRKFQRILGRTIHDELQRTKVAEAKRLLAETDDKLLVISVRSGFAHAPAVAPLDHVRAIHPHELVPRGNVPLRPTEAGHEADAGRVRAGPAWFDSHGGLLVSVSASVLLPAAIVAESPEVAG